MFRRWGGVFSMITTLWKKILSIYYVWSLFDGDPFRICMIDIEFCPRVMEDTSWLSRKLSPLYGRTISMGNSLTPLC